MENAFEKEYVNGDLTGEQVEYVVEVMAADKYACIYKLESIHWITHDGYRVVQKF